MGKNIKSYATTPSPFPRQREGSLTAKSPKNMVRLNRTHYSLLQAKVLNLSFKIWYGLTVHIIRFYRQNFQFFKIVPSSQIPANYADSAQFAHTVRELGKIRTFC